MVYYKLHRNNYFLYVWKWISSFPHSSLFVSHGPFLAITSCTTFRPRLLSSSPRNRFHPFLRVDTSLNASTILCVHTPLHSPLFLLPSFASPFALCFLRRGRPPLPPSPLPPSHYVHMHTLGSMPKRLSQKRLFETCRVN